MSLRNFLEKMGLVLPRPMRRRGIDHSGKTIECRVTAKMFNEVLDEGHQTTIVVGMLDMMEFLAPYIESEACDDFVFMLEHSRRFTSGELARKFAQVNDPNTRSPIAFDFAEFLYADAGGVPRRPG